MRARRRWLRRLALALVALLLLSALPVLVLRWVAPPTSAFMLAHALGGGEVDYRWRALPSMSPALPLALVAAEDQRFPQHHGFDVEAIRKAVAEHAEGGDLRGASTISQQVAKNLFLWSGRSFVRKGLEAYYTGLIELAWPKRRILEVYANIAEFGPGVYGAEAAARRYFGTGADALGPAQAALLAAVLPNPARLSVAAPSDYVRRRQQWIQRQARQLGPGHLAACCAPGDASR